MGYNKEAVREELATIDHEIEAGHRYVDLSGALDHPKDAHQSTEIRKTMAEIIKASWYLRTVLKAYRAFGRHRSNAIGFLAGRGQIQYLTRNEGEDSYGHLSRRGRGEGEEALRDSVSPMLDESRVQEDLREHCAEQLQEVA